VAFPNQSRIIKPVVSAEERTDAAFRVLGIAVRYKIIVNSCTKKVQFSMIFDVFGNLIGQVYWETCVGALQSVTFWVHYPKKSALFFAAPPT